MKRIIVNAEQLIRGTRDALLIVAAATYLAGHITSRKNDVDSSSYSADGHVVAVFGSQEYAFSPGIAREIAIGLVESAIAAESSAAR